VVLLLKLTVFELVHQGIVPAILCVCAPAYHDDYMKERGGLVWPDEAARDLGYSVLDILEALRKLEREGRTTESQDIHIEA
jgi:hypothetical protein